MSQILLASICVLGMASFNQISNEIILTEGTERVDFHQAIITIWTNHQFLIFNLFVSYILYARRKKKCICTILCSLQPFYDWLEVTQMSIKDVMRVTLVLAFLYLVPNVFWAASIQLGVPVTINISKPNDPHTILLFY